MLKRLVFLAFFCVAAPAAAQVQTASPLLALRDMDLRVATIGHRLALANKEICARTMPLSGMLFHAAEQYSERARPAAVSAFGLAAEPGILLVVPVSAAERAGLRPGDSILSVAGSSFAAGGSARKGSYKRVQRLEDLLLARLAEGPVAIEYRRGAQVGTATLQPEPGCLSRIQLVPSPKLNAGADGTYAQLTSAIVEFTRSDDELALVIAHEMAHNVLA
ncbi:MAG TPA: M48 family metalloprotease, partial [Allosphingosinicella sp.]|nr:M48 family metalloprotease [Allosphingosinicella sp.]